MKALTASVGITSAQSETEIARKMRDAVDTVTLGCEDAESLTNQLDSVRRPEEWLSDTDR